MIRDVADLIRRMEVPARTLSSWLLKGEAASHVAWMEASENCEDLASSAVSTPISSTVSLSGTFTSTSALRLFQIREIQGKECYKDS